MPATTPAEELLPAARGYGWVMVATFVLTTACALTYTYAPDPIGSTAFVVAAATSIAAMAIGPPLRGARPRRLWGAATLGAACFLLGLVNRTADQPSGVPSLADLFSLSGYGFLLAWLVMLLKRLGRRTARGSALDATAVAAGASLAMWSMTVSPRIGGSLLTEALMWGIYPVLDIALVSLSVQLILRVRTPAPAMWAILFGLVVLQIADTAYTVIWAHHPGLTVPALTSVFLYAYWGFAAGACHPSVPHITRSHPTSYHAIHRARSRSMLLLFMVSPAVLSILYPIQGLLDASVRSILLAVLITLLFTRLSLTMSALARAEEDSRYRASHDALTDLANRAFFLRTLEERLAHDTERADRTVAVLFFDFDNFKCVNDTWGHHVGDLLLIQISSLFRCIAREGEFMARHGGDEFVMHTVVNDPQDAQDRAMQIQKLFSEPATMAGHRISIIPSIGVACAHASDHLLATQLVRNADTALYEAKRNGRGRCVLFDPYLDRRERHRSRIASHLSRALDSESIHVVLQPIVGGEDYHQVMGWEALARWEDPILGTVPPDVFIPIAEERGMIITLGRVVLQQACSEAVRLRTALGDHLFVSVNISPRQLLDPGFCENVSQTLAETGLPTDRLWLELTESTVVDPTASTKRVLSALRDMGITVCVDDFGTGYTSLQTLLELPVNCVKLDKMLTTRSVQGQQDSTQLLSSVLAMLESLNFQHVVAEGVEAAHHKDALLAIGCPMAQGWLFGGPQRAEHIIAASASSPGTAADRVPRADLNAVDQ